MTIALKKESESAGKHQREVEGTRRAIHSLLAFPQITLAARTHKFRNPNKKTLILFRHCDSDLLVYCLTYYLLETQLYSGETALPN